MNKDVKIHLIGAGIGGLTTAAALQQRGFKPVVFEQAKQLGEVGAGLTIGPNASRVLTKMGLEPRLRELARIPRHTGLVHFKTGQPLKVESRGDFYQEQFGAPFWHIHRADMIDLLAGAVDTENSLRFEHRLERIEQDDDQVITHFANGASEQCDVLIACDGLKSPVRQQLFDDSPPEFTGFVAWRGLIERHLLAEHKIEPDFSLFPGPNALVGRYAVRDRSLVNFVAIARQEDWTTEGWMEPADIDEAKARFTGWHPAVTDLFETVDPNACFKWGLHVRQPLKQWVNGRIALLGDAAHPMTPFLGLGAAMGIEDAYVMARAFAESDGPDEALARYQNARVIRGNTVQEESQKQGLFLLNIKPGQPMDQSLTGEDPLGLYGYDATTVAI